MALTVDICGVGLIGPGLADWQAGQLVLRDSRNWRHQVTTVPPPFRLPPPERRRAGTVVKASLVIADEACSGVCDPSDLMTVFASSTGDPDNCHALCEALASPDRLLSPTRFTNSVHNAPAGYWHIATKSMQPSTSIGAYDGSFAAGLLEAVAQCISANRPVLFVSCDAPYPEPLRSLRPIADVFGVAMLLGPAAQGPAGIRLELTTVPDLPATACAEPQLDALRISNPAARALPLLQLLAQRHSGTVVIETSTNLSIQLKVGPP